MYHISLFLFRFYLLLFRKRKAQYGKRHIPKGGPLIVVANHVGDDDPWIVSDLFSERRVIHWWAKRELIDVKERAREYRELKQFGRLLSLFLAWGTMIIVKNSRTILVDRTDVLSRLNRQAVAESARVLHGGGIIGIFGSGGQGRVGEARAIFVKLALRHRALILPIRIAEDMIVIGMPIDLREKPWNDGADAEQTAHRIMALIESLEA